MTEGKGINTKAVLLGVLVDIGCSLAVGFVIGFVWVIGLAAQGIPADEMADRTPGGLPVIIPSLVLGWGATVLGGYVAGRVAKQAEVLHGGIVGAAAVPLGILSAALFPIEWPLWLYIPSLVGNVLAGMAGGVIAKQRRDRKPPTASTL